MKKAAYIILILFGLSLFGLMVRHVYTGGERLGFLTEPIKQFTSWPLLIRPSVNEVTELPLQFHKTPEDLKKTNALKADVFVLATISDSDFKRKIVLKNLKSDSIIYTWNVDYFFDKNDRLLQPLLLDNKELFVIANKKKQSLLKIDSTGAILWESSTDSIPHHSLNLSEDEKYLWTPGGKLDKNSRRKGFTHKLIRPDGEALLVEDDLLLKWNIETGAIDYSKSMFQLFQENDLLYKIKKAPLTYDPFHLNDIEPVLITNEHFQKGDLLLSFRKLSAIIHFRPDKDSIINYIEGPFTFQHDVDIVNDSTIVFFNNNTFFVEYKASLKQIQNKTLLDSIKMPSSNIMFYNYKSKQFSILKGDKLFREKLFSHTQGLVSEIDDDTFLVEEPDTGILWIIKDKKVIYKGVFKSKHAGYHHMLNWTRVIDKLK